MCVVSLQIIKPENIESTNVFYFFSRVSLFSRDYDNWILMSASPTREVATTTAITQMEVTHVPVIIATSITVMHTHVKVGLLNKTKSITVSYQRPEYVIYYRLEL